MKDKKFFDLLTQFALPGFTIGAQIALSLKFPEWSLVINLLAQPFWLYSSFKGYKQAGQIGMFINTIIMTIIISLGVINYWLF